MSCIHDSPLPKVRAQSPTAMSLFMTFGTIHRWLIKRQGTSYRIAELFGIRSQLGNALGRQLVLQTLVLRQQLANMPTQSS